MEPKRITLTKEQAEYLMKNYRVISEVELLDRVLQKRVDLAIEDEEDDDFEESL